MANKKSKKNKRCINNYTNFSNYKQEDSSTNTITETYMNSAPILSPDKRDELLIRVDERVQGLYKMQENIERSMNNHLQHHETFERNVETRLDELAARNLFTPVIKFIKWIISR